MTDDDRPLGLTRRQALAAAAALCGLGVAGAATGTAQAAQTRAKTLRVVLSRYPALKKVGGAAVVGSLGATQVAVVRTGSKTYVALDRRCPHQGAIVGPSGDGWLCPLHGSRFDLDGDRISGPTPSGLRRLRSRLRKGVLIVG